MERLRSTVKNVGFSLVLWLVFGNSAVAPWAVEDDGCRTPGRGVGNCIDLILCKPMIDFLAQIQGKPLDERTKEFIRKYQCGVSANGVKVCCPSTAIMHEWVVLDDNGCRTPDKGVGSCVSIYSCQPIIDVIAKYSSETLTSEIRNTILAYQCGQDATSPKVCCPAKPILLNFDENRDPLANRNLDLLPLNACGVTPNIDRIINGNKTQLFEFPWMAALKYTTSKDPPYRCGGTLINKRYILTAAHCIRTAKLPLIGVRLGEYDLSKEDDCEKRPRGTPICAPPVQDFDITVDDAIVHPMYNDTPNANDIALIRLPRDADTSVNSVKPVCLPVQENSRNNNLTKKVTVTGWGATETGISSPDLLKVYLPVIPNNQCTDYYKNVISISNKQLCAGGRDFHDSCAGDSGGPLMEQVSFDGDLRTVQYGIVSFGPRLCGRENFPGVYTRITEYLNWILDNIKS